MGEVSKLFHIGHLSLQRWFFLVLNINFFLKLTLCVHVVEGTYTQGCRGYWRIEVFSTLVLELLTIVSHLIWILRTEPVSSVWAENNRRVAPHLSKAKSHLVRQFLFAKKSVTKPKLSYQVHLAKMASVFCP